MGLSSAYALTVEPKATFENPEDYTHIFCIEEGQAWKLMSALYDAKVNLMSRSRALCGD